MVGTAPSSIHAPIKDKSWEIWAVNVRMEHVTRITRLFQVHRLAGEGDADGWREHMKQFAKNTELWMFWPEPLGKVVQFPYQAIMAKYGAFFMTSSFSWMMALAIDEMRPDEGNGGGEISLYGVDMEFGTEYHEQRHGLRHFMELAKHLGIAVSVRASSGIAIDPIPYPFWEDDPFLNRIRLRRKLLGEENAFREKTAEASRIMIGQNRAASRELAALLPKLTKTNCRELIKTLDGRSAKLEAGLPQLDHDVAWSEGVLDEIDQTEKCLTS